mgnify:CR=1 FL=1
MTPSSAIARLGSGLLRTTAVAACVVAVAALTAGCGRSKQRERPRDREQPLQADLGNTLVQAITGKRSAPVTAQVVEIVESGAFTVLRLADESTRAMVVTPAVSVAPDDSVTIRDFEVVRSFQARPGGRRYDVVLLAAHISGKSVRLRPFVEAVHDPGPGLPPGHPPLPERATVDVITIRDGQVVIETVTGIEKADQAIVEIVGNREAFRDRFVKVRGKAVQVVTSLGRTWVRLRDGSARGEQGELMVTTDVDVQAGDILLVEGTIGIDRDYGVGAHYVALLEAATLTVEPGPQPFDPRL